MAQGWGNEFDTDAAVDEFYQAPEPPRSRKPEPPAPAADPAPSRMAETLKILAALHREYESLGATVPDSAIAKREDDLAMIEMRVSTLTNLIAARRNSPPPPPEELALSSEAAQVVARLVELGKQNTRTKLTPAQDGQVVGALQNLCGNEAMRRTFTEVAFGKRGYKELSAEQQAALFAWLKPTGQGMVARTTNIETADGVAAVLKCAKFVAAEPA